MSPSARAKWERETNYIRSKDLLKKSYLVHPSKNIFVALEESPVINKQAAFTKNEAVKPGPIRLIMSLASDLRRASAFVCYTLAYKCGFFATFVAKLRVNELTNLVNHIIDSNKFRYVLMLDISKFDAHINELHVFATWYMHMLWRGEKMEPFPAVADRDSIGMWWYNEMITKRHQTKIRNQ